jgi:hypothetical protein
MNVVAPINENMAGLNETTYKLLILSVITLNVVMLNVIILSVIILSVIILTVIILPRHSA